MFDNIKDVLTAYFTNDEETKIIAYLLNMTVDDVAELRASLHQHTDEGKEIYSFIMQQLNSFLERSN